MSADIEGRATAFPRAVRLRSPQQFRTVFSQGRRVNAAMFRLHVHFVIVGEGEAADAGSEIAVTSATERTQSKHIDASTASARLGISVPKRVAASAVERNRIRRIARESFRHQRQDLPAGDYVLLAQRGVSGASSAVLREGLLSLWLRATALKPARFAPTMPSPGSKPEGADPRPSSKHDP